MLFNHVVISIMLGREDKEKKRCRRYYQYLTVLKFKIKVDYVSLANNFGNEPVG
ncbi:hypothetical protein SBF1_1580002 [Candidatus Desulfosporosinus infrequens]|uniref:Uncharacterized protein n=1 Tax=Candidatus Desulfosporosinus infrequens TaxID=2043169 RepID=A0A2U3K8G8_9FIRM|nr:hypothetical protein SBF1_1580002 [Candidatus Desulfosporosinus infrequens]